MNIFHNRPLALSCVLLAVCSVFAYRMSPHLKLILAITALSAFLMLLLFLLYKKGGKRLIQALLCFAAVAISLGSSYLYFQVRYARYSSYVDKEILVEGVVLERGSSAPFFTSLEVALDRVDGVADHVNARLVTSYPSVLQVGNHFSMPVTVVKPNEAELIRTEDTFLSDGNLMYLTSSEETSYQILPEEGFDLRVWASKLNTRLSYALRNRIGGEAGGIASALLLGNRTWLSDRTTLEFRRAGISHLLALSGLHVSILIAFVDRLLQKLRIQKVYRAVFIPLLSFGYLALTGFSVSTWRAVLMMSVLYLGYLLQTDYDSVTALCVVLALILTVTPYAVLDCSLWMSFLAAGSIVLFSPVIDQLCESFQQNHALPTRLYVMLKSIVLAVSVGIVANLALMLYTALVFGEISMASVPATLLLSVPVSLLLIFAAILVCFPFLPILPWICAFLGTILLKVARFFSDIRNVMMPAMGIVTRFCLILLTLFLIFLAVAKLKNRLWAIPVPCMLILTICLTQVATLSTVRLAPITIPAGHGEVRLYTQGGENILVNDTRGNASEAYEIKLFATADFCTEITDLVFCRYYNQATYFISRLSGQIMVRCIHLPEPDGDREHAIAKRLEEEAAVYDIEVLYDAEKLLAAYDGK